MPSLSFRIQNSSNNPNNKKWRDLMPQRLAWNGCLLLDDTIHRGITRTAEKIENSRIGNKIGLTRKILAHGTLVVSTLAGLPSIYLHPPTFLISHINPIITNVGSSAFSLGYLPIIGNAVDFRASSSTPTKSLEDMICRILRFPMFTTAIIFVIGAIYDAWKTRSFNAWNLWAIETGIQFTFFSLATYLASSSNGMLDYVENAVAGFLAPIPVDDETILVPIKVKQ